MEGRTFLEGEFLETVIGIPGSRTEILMLRPPGGGTGLELASFVRPDPGPGVPGAMAHELGLRSVVFEVEDLHEMVDRLGAAGYGLIGGIGEYEQVWRMASSAARKGSSSPWRSAWTTSASLRHPCCASPRCTGVIRGDSHVLRRLGR